MSEKQINQLVYLKSEVKSEQKNTPKLVSTVVKEFQAETVSMMFKNSANLLDMAIKQRTLKIFHTSAIVDKNATVATVNRALRETVGRETKLMKDIRV